MKFVVISRTGLLCAVMVAMSIPPLTGNGAEIESRGTSPAGGSSPVYLLMLSQPPVQRDLKLSPSQIDAVSALMHEFTECAQAAIKEAEQAGLRKTTPLPKLLARQSAEATRRVTEIVSRAQFERLEQLHLRAARAWIIFEPKIRKKLGLSSETMAGARQILRDCEASCAQIAKQMKGGKANPEQAMARIDDLRQRAHKEVFLLFAPAQRLKLQGLLGPDPDFDPAKLKLRLRLSSEPALDVTPEGP